MNKKEKEEFAEILNSLLICFDYSEEDLKAMIIKRDILDKALSGELSYDDAYAQIKEVNNSIDWTYKQGSNEITSCKQVINK